MSNKAEEYELMLKSMRDRSQDRLLRSVGNFNDLNIQAQSKLLDLYQMDDVIFNRMATIIRSAICQQTICFGISLRLLIDLLKKDDKNKFKSCSTKQYQELMFCAEKYNILKNLRPPVSNKAGMYELVNNIYVDLIVQSSGLDLLKAKKALSLAEFDEEVNSMVKKPVYNNDEFDAILKSAVEKTRKVKNG